MRWVSWAGSTLALVGCGSPAHPCDAPPDQEVRPHTIEEAVELVNTLPLPVTVPCVVRALGGRLGATSTSSSFSAQPALGAESPRIFLFSDELVLSLSLHPDVSHLIEFGEHLGDGLSVKGELVFPAHDVVPPSAPYDHLSFTGQISTCAFCHANEQGAGVFDGAVAYRSQALKPRPTTHVPLSILRSERNQCGDDDTGRRCELLRALAAADLYEQPFPDSYGEFGP